MRPLLVRRWRCGHEKDSGSFLGPQCGFWALRSFVKCFCGCGAQRSGLKLSLTAISATRFIKGGWRGRKKALSLIPIYCLWRAMVQHTWWLLLSSNKWNLCAFFFLFFLSFNSAYCTCLNGPVVTQALECNIILSIIWARGVVVCQVGLRPKNEKLQYSQGSVQLGRTKSAITLLLLFFSSSNSD